MDFIPAPILPYSADALEPHISEETLRFHHGKHHMAYYNKTKEFEQGQKPRILEDVVRTTKGGHFNNAAQLYNHAFYWKCMAPNPTKEDRKPTGRIAQMINEAFGSYEQFREKFEGMAKAAFGSGWVWLIEKNGKLELLEGHDGDCPIRGDRGTPVLCLDVWEHAYYIDYRNARPDYITAWWKLVNWDFCERQLSGNVYNYQAEN